MTCPCKVGTTVRSNRGFLTVIKKMPRPTFEPTPEQRVQVRTLAECGAPEDYIATKIGIAKNRIENKRTHCRSISRLNSKPVSRKRSFRSRPLFSIRSSAAAGSPTSAPGRPWRFSTRKPAWGGKKRAFICMAKLTQIQTPPSKHSLADLIASLPEKERRRRLRRLGAIEQQARFFCKNRGVALLVRKGNPL